MSYLVLVVSLLLGAQMPRQASASLATFDAAQAAVESQARAGRSCLMAVRSDAAFPSRPAG